MPRGRPPEVFVRRLTPKEGNQLLRIVRRPSKGTSQVTWRRALVVLMSGQRRTVADIARLAEASEDWVRDVIRAFNASGMEALHPKWRGGRPRKITDPMRAEIVRVAKTRPQVLGEPYTRWSLSKLRDYLLRNRIVPGISKERLREILHEEGTSIQRTKSWKRSPDPDFDEKAQRIRRLYGDLPGAVVCFDEHGAVQPVPKPGWGWAARNLPQRLPANYRKPHGVRFFFGAYDVGGDRLWGRWFEKKGSAPTLTFLKAIRRCYGPEVRIHLVMDNLSAHWTEDITTWAAENNVELVPTPTYASFLNRIEAEFGVMVQFVFAGSDYRDHAEIERATSAYLRRRNAEARRNFATRQAEKARRRERRARARALRLARAA